jgi:hypothetical protein
LFEWFFRVRRFDEEGRVPLNVFDASLDIAYNAGFLKQENSFDMIERMFRTQNNYITDHIDQYSNDFATRVSKSVYLLREDRDKDFLNHL